LDFTIALPNAIDEERKCLIYIIGKIEENLPDEENFQGRI